MGKTAFTIPQWWPLEILKEQYISNDLFWSKLVSQIENWYTSALFQYVQLLYVITKWRIINSCNVFDMDETTQIN